MSNGPLVALECAPCGRAGVWLPGGAVVVHAGPHGTTEACPLPPRDISHLSERQESAVRGAIAAVLAEREARAAA